MNIVTRFFTLITAAAALAACGGGSDSPETAPSNQSPTPGTVAVAAATYAVEQSAGTVTLSVARTGGSSGAASVTYATSDGTGKAGTDYTATTGTFSWTDGDAAAKTVAVPISAATGFSGTKTFSFTLSGVSGAALGSPASATVTINGSGTPSDGGQTAAGTLRFSANTYSAQQTAGTVTVTVNRAGGSTGAVTVQYATSNGTASAGTHYTTKTGTLSWAAGSTTAQTFTVALATSPAFSGSKSFTVTLSAPTGGATLGTPATSTVNIVGATPATLSVRVQGNKLIDAQGNTLQLRGVNTASLEFWPIQTSNTDYWGGQKPNLDAIKAWGANTIRVPLNSTSYLGLTCYNMNDGSARKADPQSKYPAVVKEIVDAATARGLYVILDLHKNAPKGTVPGKGKVQTCSISSTQQQMADADNSEAFWTAVATDFQGYPNVIFDLYNEPYFDSFAGVANDAGKWKALRDGGVSNFFYASNQTVNEQTPTAGMQAMLNAVRATGATNVVMSAGISWAQDFSQWVQYKPNDPLGQLAMSWHAYPFYGASFGTPQYTQPGLGAVSYDWAQAALDAGFPIIIGETGDRSVNGTTSAPFLGVLLPWADSHNVSVVGWGWNAWGEASANLIKDASGTPTDGYGVAFKAWLVNHP